MSNTGCQADQVCIPGEECQYVQDLYRDIQFANDFREIMTATTRLTELQCDATKSKYCCATPKAKGSSFKIDTQIKHDYAITTVEATIKNNEKKPKHETFYITVPETALVANFTMTLNGETYTGVVKTKEEAEAIFNTLGSTKAIINVDEITHFQQHQRISFSVKLEPNENVRFELIYEELLQRVNGAYDYNIFLQPTVPQSIEDVKISVKITGKSQLKDLEWRLFRSPADVKSTAIDLKHNYNKIGEGLGAILDIDGIKLKENLEDVFCRVDEYCTDIKLKLNYDMQYPENGNDLQIVNDYTCIHSFIPDILPTRPIHSIFVIDVSGSMQGSKLRQTKEALVELMYHLKDPEDTFTIITFNSDIKVWPEDEKPYKPNILGKNRPEDYIHSLKATGGTNIHDALTKALNLAKKNKERDYISKKTIQMVFFLSDGQPTSGTTDTARIVKDVTNYASDLSIPIYSIAFGKRADLNFLKQISKLGKATAIEPTKIDNGRGFDELEDFFEAIKEQKESNMMINYEVNNKTYTENVRQVIGGTKYIKRLTASEIIETVKITLLAGQNTERQSFYNVDHVNEKDKFLERQASFIQIKKLSQGTDAEKKNATKLAIEQQLVIPQLTAMIVEAKNGYKAQGLQPQVHKSQVHGEGELASPLRSKVPVDKCANLHSTGSECTSELCPGLPRSCPSSDCKLTLYSRARLRGRNVTLDCAVENLESMDFDDNLVTLEVQGECCWKLYNEPNFEGVAQFIYPYNMYPYKINPFDVDITEVYRKASSAHQVSCPTRSCMLKLED